MCGGNLADLWNRTTKEHYIPARWRESLTTFIPKGDGSDRPITLTAVAWRTRASMLARRLADDVADRIPTTILPMPRRHLTEPLQAILAECKTTGRTGAFASSHKIYPWHSTLCLHGKRWRRRRPTALRTMCWPRLAVSTRDTDISSVRTALPPRSGRLARGTSTRLPAITGVPGCDSGMGERVGRRQDHPHHNDNILEEKARDDEDADGRRVRRIFECLERAKKRSDDFDEAYQLKTNKTKCKVSASCPRVAGLAAMRLGYQSEGEEVAILGVKLKIGRAEGKAECLRYDRSKVLERLRRISYAVTAPGARRRLIASLVMPMLTWATSVVGCGDDTDKVQVALDRARLARKPAGAARRLIAELDDMGGDLKTITRWRAVTTLLKIEALHDYNPEWLGRPPTDHREATTLDIPPGAGEILWELGWHYDSNEGVIDNGASGLFRIGSDGMQNLYQGVKDHRRWEPAPEPEAAIKTSRWA